MLTTLAYWIPWQLRGESKVGDSDWVPVSKPRWPIESRFCEDKFSNVKKNRLRPFIKERRSCRQDLNRKSYQSLLIYCTKTAQNSQFSHNSEFLVPSALHFLMGSPATRQGHEKLVYRLIYLFSSTEIFSKRRKICSCWRKTRATDHALDLTLCSNWPANAHGTQYQLSPATTHASSIVNVPIRRHPGIEALYYLLAPCNRSHDQLQRKC